MEGGHGGERGGSEECGHCVSRGCVHRDHSLFPRLLQAELERAHQEIKHLKHVAKQATERHERIIVDLKRQIAQERDALNHQVAELKAKAAIPVAAPAPTTTSDRVVNKFAPKTVDLRKKTIGENGAATEVQRVKESTAKFKVLFMLLTLLSNLAHIRPRAPSPPAT